MWSREWLRRRNSRLLSPVHPGCCVRVQRLADACKTATGTTRAVTTTTTAPPKQTGTSPEGLVRVCGVAIDWGGKRLGMPCSLSLYLLISPIKFLLTLYSVHDFKFGGAFLPLYVCMVR